MRRIDFVTHHLIEKWNCRYVGEIVKIITVYLHAYWRGRKKFFLYPSFFGCPNNQISIGQINRRKTNLVMYILGSHKNMCPTVSQAIELVCC